MRDNKVRNLAISAMLVALSVVICVFASLFPTMSLAITAMTGIISAVVLVRCGYKYSLLVYIAASLLSLLLVPNKECAIYYMVLFGHYPMLKLFTERIANRVLVWIAKLAEANVLYFIAFLITTYLLGISEEVGTLEMLLTALLFDAAFVIYDICLGRIMPLFILKHPKRTQNDRFR